MCGGVLASGLPGEDYCLSPGTLAAGLQPMPEYATKMVRRGPKADHTLHKTDPSLPPSPALEADTRPRPTKGPACPGLAYPAPSFPPTPMPSTSAEANHTLSGGGSWGLGTGLVQGGKGQADSVGWDLAPR